MADNSDRTPGSGETIRSEDRAGVKTQVVVLDIGGATAEHMAGGTQKGGTDYGLWVDPRPDGSRIQVASAGLTTATTGYTNGDQLGAELTFANAARDSGGTGIIQSATLLDKAHIIGGVDLLLFDRTATPAADNAAADFSDADMLNFLGVIEFPTPKQQTSNWYTYISALGLAYKLNGTSLFGSLVTRSDHTFFGAVGDLVVSLHCYRD